MNINDDENFCAADQIVDDSRHTKAASLDAAHCFCRQTKRMIDDGSFCGKWLTQFEKFSFGSYIKLELLLVILVVVFASVVLLRRRRRRSSSSTAICQDHESKNEHDQTTNEQLQQQLQRKRDFLQRAGIDYGYANSACGFIDAWRSSEFPGLIAPLPAAEGGESQPMSPCRSEPLHNIDDDFDRLVYLDYAGAALASRKLRQAIFSDDSLAILANPHSSGPAAATTLRLMETSTKRVLRHFHGGGEQVNGPLAWNADASQQSTCTGESQQQRQQQQQLHHPGYQVLFTSGATEALRIVAERFPWFRACQKCSSSDENNLHHVRQKSLLVYPHNAHTSVIGMRGPALAQGADFVCLNQGQCYVDTLRTLIHSQQQQRRSDTSRDGMDCECCHQTVHHLVVLTPECNFGGDRLVDIANTVANLRALSIDGHCVTILMDIAKAASTGPVNLRQLDADLACVSFYKLFGEPTGVGCLLVKQTAVETVVGEDTASTELGQVRRYFGGGSVDIAIPSDDYAVLRNEPSLMASLVQGTCHYRGICSLVHGFDELDSLGGMESVRRHTLCLAKELVRCLKSLRHENGKRVIVLYGDWNGYDEICDAVHEAPGPTIAFNVMRHDGSYVGYNEVSKLAALNQPPIQLRTGCFCNPGACQAALHMSSADLRHNFELAGHICGDQIDIIDNRPTGAVRASFGKDSLWEDLDEFVAFVTRMFASQESRVEFSVWDGRPQHVIVRELYVFPIKSCAAQRVKRWRMLSGGRLLFDREFTLVDCSGNAMRLPPYPNMAFIKPSIDIESWTMRVSAPGCVDLVIHLTGASSNSHQPYDSPVKVCGNMCGGAVWGDASISNWFSDYLGVRCWLARHMGDIMSPSVKPSNNGRSSNIAFANEQPLLLISEHAVNRLNSVLTTQHKRLVSSRHFRPNFVTRCMPLSDDTDHEDHWTKVLLPAKQLGFEVVGPCARCSMVDIDPTSGMKGNTLRAMAESRRRRKGQITFGIFLRINANLKDPEGAAWLEEGDLLVCE
ncbi:hypothetical protein MPSEU_000119600 [Mayamaea pseudoterrestris]|nr:hypothetical protein MPSEU_000119600 [Mayamaea pseudoterrestris]